MNGDQFREEIIRRVGNVESDIAYIRGVLEGRDHKRSNVKDNLSIGISCVSLLVSALLVISRFFS